jgi:hypothetical protein
MISSKFDINEFLEAQRDRDYFDIVFLADKEATEAERIALKSGYEIGEREKNVKAYANDLKDLIIFLRSNIRPKRLENKFGQLMVKSL